MPVKVSSHIRHKSMGERKLLTPNHMVNISGTFINHTCTNKINFCHFTALTLMSAITLISEIISFQITREMEMFEQSGSYYFEK